MLAGGQVEQAEESDYDGSVDEGSRAKTLTLRFLRRLRKENPPPSRIQLGAPVGCPSYDRYTYRQHGHLYVQHYQSPGLLKAWCFCGNWTVISVEEIEANTRDTCRDCENPSPLLTQAVRRMEGEL